MITVTEKKKKKDFETCMEVSGTVTSWDLGVQ
jgi:hypothetical protein